MVIQRIHSHEKLALGNFGDNRLAQDIQDTFSYFFFPPLLIHYVQSSGR